jgi:hypothetical protein
MNSALAQASFTPNSAGTSGVLNLTDGTHTANLTLFGTFTGNFMIGPDSGIGTDIKFHASSVQPMITLHS